MAVPHVDDSRALADLFLGRSGSDLWTWLERSTLAQAFEAHDLRAYLRSVVRINFARGESVVVDLGQGDKLQFCPRGTLP